MPPRNTPERVRRLLIENVERTDSGCHLWTGRLDLDGYAKSIRVDGRWLRMHRLAYELAVGQIAAGLDVDHLCHTRDVSCRGGTECPHRRCINPDHMELVTRSENTRRGRGRLPECKYGHPYDEENTRVDKRGRRTCRRCNADAVARLAARKKEAA